MSRQEERITGRIFDIQRYSIHDGPGIRTIVFLKGCILRCQWCCNPESQACEIQTMQVDGKTKIIGRDITVEEVMDTVKKDRPYYRRSGGGITLSGGECFLQPEFTKALLQAAKEAGISTAVETTAAISYKWMAPSLPYLDTILMDIKHMNPTKHKEFTGIDNQDILINAGKLAKEHNDLIIRIPVIPGFNDSRTEIGDIARFASTLTGVKELHLLPYHRLGQDKYVGLGRSYALEGVAPLTKERMEELLQEANGSGLQCQIGG